MSTAGRSVVLHGHFYQPPREDPWLDEVEAEPSAAPFHDWNERIEQECYRAVVAARVLGPDGRIARIVNALERMSFDVGPTLLEWLERAAPATYAAVLEADAASVARLGFGNAVAMPYHHAILPLCSRRDKVTEVRWGIADFRRRFRRDPVGMWLPETAVDHETLDVLAAEGIRFTVVAPHQVTRAPARGRSGRVRTSGEREIAVFVYEGTVSTGVAFGPLIRDAAAWVAAMAPDPSEDAPQLVAVATDGETFGHHHRFGEMALAAVLEQLSRRDDVRVENFAAFLARHPPEEELTLVEPSSWSCPHGVERWRADCGCRAAPERDSHQRWRAPLREALDWLAERVHEIFEREGAPLLGDPWAARDAYGAVVADAAGTDPFTDQWLSRATGNDRVRGRELLEMERNALRMFTSCGWFFDDFGGIEGRQVLRYAARAIDVAGAAGVDLERGLLDRLTRAESNDPTVGTGAEFYARRVKPSVPRAAQVAAGHVAARRLAPEVEALGSRGYAVHETNGRVVTRQRRTGRTHAFQVRWELPGLAAFSVYVTGSDQAPIELGLFDLPEPVRRPLARVLQTAVTNRRFGDRERAALASGIALVNVATEALVNAVRALEDAPSPDAHARVIDLADLLELLGEPVPFDAQTAFYRLRERLPKDRVTALAPVARRLGFSS